MPIFNFQRHLLAGVRRLAVPGDGGRFWIGQFMVIISTILGVYLAANAGFQRAIEFDAMINKRSAYHLLTSLEAELKDNVEINKKLAVDLNTGSLNRSYYIRRSQMGFFIWQAMQETDKTFQVPAEVLTGVRRYYKSVEVLRQEYDQSKIPATYFKKRVEEEHAIILKSILPKLQQEKENVRAVLNRLSVELS